MHILHCILSRGFAGTERYVSDLVTLQARQHSVTLLLAAETRDSRTGADITDHLPPGIRIVRTGKAGALPALARLCLTLRPDILHSHLGHAGFRAGLLAWLRRHLPGTRRFLPPVVATLHRAWSARAYSRHDGLICIASWQRAEIPPSFRGLVETITNWTVRRPAPPDAREQLLREFKLPPDTFLIGAAGRMIPEKGFRLLIEAFQNAALPRTALILFGDGPQRAELAAMAGPDVSLPGYRQNLPASLAGLDAFVLPSRHEPFGLVLLEAMAAGLPVLATAAGGVTDILAGHPDCMVPPDDLNAMTAGLKRLRAKPRQTWDLSAFTPEKQAEQIDTFYRRCIARTRPA